MFKHISVATAGVATGIHWAEAKDAANHPSNAQGRLPLQRRTWVPNANSAEADEPAPDLSHRPYLVISFISSPNRMHGLQEVPPSSLGGNMRNTNQDDL